MNLLITSGKGFHLTFKNGITISTQIGHGNYCQNNCNMQIAEKMRGSAYSLFIESQDCEIALFDKDDKFITKYIMNKFDKEKYNNLSDDVVGYLDLEEWFKLIKFIESLN